MSLDAIYATSTFYTLQALKVLVKPEFGRKSAEKLLSDILDYESKYIEKLSIMLFDYSVLVCYGEMRHAKSQCSHLIPAIKQGGNRNGSYIIAKDFSPINILRLAEKQFGNYTWGSAYGGKKWANIAHTVLKKGRIDNLIFCDTCFSLSHNNSPYVNKEEAKIFKLNSCNEYKKFLDIKFSLTPVEIIKNALPKLNTNVLKFIQRAINLGYIKENIPVTMNFDDHYHQKYEEFVFSYMPINWGKNFIPEVFVESKECFSSENDERNDERDYNSSVRTLKDCDNNHLKIGDEVEVTEAGKNFCGNHELIPGMKGIVKHFDCKIGVKFSKKMSSGHDLGGHCQYGYGYYLHSNMVKKVAKTVSKPKNSNPEDFQVGDEVIITKRTTNSSIKIGSKGIVKHVHETYNSIGVEFSEKIEAGWNINGHSRYGYGWYIHKNSIQKVVKKVQAEEILDISKLHVGDEVIANNEAHFLNSKIKDGFVGTMKEINYSGHIGIEFSENIGGHILNGNCKQGCGWWFDQRSFHKYFKRIVKNKIVEDAA